jgi:toxin ParE1/3/4
MSVHRRPQARQDIIDLADYLDQISQNLADRFLDGVEQTITSLEGMPGMGAPLHLNNPGLQGLRHHPVQGFPNHVIFYLPTDDGIDVVRILHGARDVVNILEAEP